jgi:hypothetical protein
VPHGLAGRRCVSRDVADDRLRHLCLDEGGGFLLLVASDLADHDHLLGLLVGLEEPKNVDEGRADDRVSTDPDDGRAAESELCELVTDLVRERAGARHEPDGALAEDLGGDDPHVRLPGRERPGTVRPDDADVPVLYEMRATGASRARGHPR